MNLAPIGFGTAFFSFLDSEDFAVDNIGKVEEKFVIILYISWTKLSMFFSVPVVIEECLY